MRVPRKFAQLNSGAMVAGPTKSTAGLRTVALPELILADLRLHLERHVKDGPDALVFTGEKGAILKRGNWRRSVKWAASAEQAGLPTGFRFHDLRHTGNHLAAAAGASTRELMHRMGHGSTRAALIYQHATSDRDLEIAKESTGGHWQLARRPSRTPRMRPMTRAKTSRTTALRASWCRWPNSTLIAREDRETLTGYGPRSVRTPFDVLE